MSQSIRCQSSNIRNVQKSQLGALWAKHFEVFVFTLWQRGSTVFGGQNELGQVGNIGQNFSQRFVERVEDAGTDGTNVEQSGKVQPGDVRFDQMTEKCRQRRNLLLAVLPCYNQKQLKVYNFPNLTKSLRHIIIILITFNTFARLSVPLTFNYWKYKYLVVDKYRFLRTVTSSNIETTRRCLRRRAAISSASSSCPLTMRNVFRIEILFR